MGVLGLKTSVAVLGLCAVVAGAASAFADQRGCGDEFLSPAGRASKILDRIEQQKAKRADAERARADRLNAINDLITYAPIALGWGAVAEARVRAEPFFQLLKRMLEPIARLNSGMIFASILGPPNVGKSTLSNDMGPILSNSDLGTRGAEQSPTHRTRNTTVRSIVKMAADPNQDGDSPVKQDALVRTAGGEDFTAETNFKDRNGGTVFTYDPGLDQFVYFVLQDLPDIASGSIVEHTKEQHLEAVKNAVLPSDVIFLMFDENNIHIRSLKWTIAEIFKTYGQRKIVLLNRINLNGKEDLADAKATLTEVAWELVTASLPKGQERDANFNSADVLPDAVLGIYAVPFSPMVKGREERTSLIPLGTSLEFPELIRRLSFDGSDVRAFGERSAGRVVYGEIKDRIADHYYRLYLAQIYAHIIRGAVDIPPAPRDFPFFEAKRRWLKQYGKQRGLVIRAVNKIGGAGFHVAKKVLNFFGSEPKLSDLQSKSKDDLQTDWLARVKAIEADLATGRIDISRTRALELEILVRKFNALFPGEPLEIRITPKSDDPKSHFLVNLPQRDDRKFDSPQDHPAEVYLRALRAARTKIEMIQTPQWPTQLSEVFDHAIKDFRSTDEAIQIDRVHLGANAVSVLAGGAVGGGVSKFGGAVKNLIPRLGSRAIPMAGTAAGTTAGTAAGVGAGGGTAAGTATGTSVTAGATSVGLLPVIGTAVVIGFIASHAAYFFDERKLTESLNNFVNPWFAREQSRQFRALMEREVIQVAGEALDQNQSPLRLAAFKAIQAALVTLGVEMPQVFKDHLNEYEDQPAAAQP